jgi:hypothetical protein
MHRVVTPHRFPAKMRNTSATTRIRRFSAGAAPFAAPSLSLGESQSHLGSSGHLNKQSISISRPAQATRSQKHRKS